MMRELDLKLKQDRALRNAARALVQADFANVRADLAGRGFGARIVDRINDGAVDIFEEAVELADSNRGVLAGLIGAVLLWFARNPVLALFAGDAGDKDVTGEGRAGDPDPPETRAT